MHRNLKLFFTMAKICATCFGGGYVILPLLRRDLVEKKGWISEEDLTDIFAIAQCTPGVIVVNAATYVGTKIGGVPGAICATLGVLTPPMIIISLVATFFWPYLLTPVASHALAGLQACVCALIFQAVVSLFKAAIIDPFSFLIFAACFLLSLLAGVSPALLVLGAGAAGFLYHRLWGRRKKP